MISRLRHTAQSQFLKWVSKRSTISEKYTLHQKNLYIFPSLTGCAFLFLALIIWLLGTNYQNNLILALAYMQISLFVVIILNTYNNLSGLEVGFSSVENACVGESVDFTFTVYSPNKIGAHYVTVGWRPPLQSVHLRGNAYTRLFDFEPSEVSTIKASVEALHRGYVQPRHLLIKSTFPMGLLKCWTWLTFDAKAIVYPAPVLCSLPRNTGGSEDEEGEGYSMVSGDDFMGFSEYHPGDSLKHIAWKLYARERGLYCKQFLIPESHQVWLSWSDFYHGDTELCLSNLCYWAMIFNQQNQEFGLKLPDEEVVLGLGDLHLKKTLTALALFSGQG